MTKTHFSWLGSPDQITFEKVIWSEIFSLIQPMIFSLTISFIRSFLPSVEIHKGGLHREGEGGSPKADIVVREVE